MTESNQGPATPGTAARCEICGRVLAKSAPAAGPHECFPASQSFSCMLLGLARLKAENASLRADLAAAAPALDALAEYVAEVDREGWPSAEWSDANLERMRDALRVAGRMGEPQVSASKTPSDSESLPTRASPLESLREKDAYAEQVRVRSVDYAQQLRESRAHAAAAEQRAEAAEKRATELMGALRKIALNDGSMSSHEMIFAAEDAIARAALHDEERRHVSCYCGKHPMILAGHAHIEAFRLDAGGPTQKHTESYCEPPPSDEERSAPQEGEDGK